MLGVRSVFGFTRSRIEVTVTTRFNNASSQYSPTSDFIQIRPVDAYGAWGVFAAAHEYGHAVQKKTSAGLPPNACAGAHYLNLPSNEGCAFSEGFANFISVASSPTNNSIAADAESNYYSSCTPAGSCEMKFAGMLLDLMDPINTSDPDGYSDVLQLPARHVFDLIGACSLRFVRTLPYFGEVVSTSWQGPTGTSQVRDCMLNNGPTFVGPFQGDELWWMDRTLPWPVPTGSLYNDVLARMTRP